MAISNPQEVPEQKHEAPHVSSVRRRTAAGMVSVSTSVSDSSSPAFMRETETSTGVSEDESFMESSTEPWTTDRVENKTVNCQTMDRGDCPERGENQDDDRGDSGGEFPLRYMFPASAPAHRRVKESPLSSDAIFRQVSVYCCS